MSFTSEIKNELCKAGCGKKQLPALCCGTLFAMAADGESRFFTTEHKKAAEFIYKTLQRRYSAEAVNMTLTQKTDRELYGVFVSNGVGADNCDCSSDEIFSAFLRGVFLVCGFVSDPEKNYQLELFLSGAEKCAVLKSMIEEHGMSIKYSSRRSSGFLYLKESERISDMLAFMGAMNGAMSIINAKIFKEVRNNVNRSVNCEAANLNKTISAAHKQADDISFIINTKGRGYLTDELLQVADIRLNATELSLSEIGRMLEPPITRSGVNHRLKRISEIADKLRKENKV